LINDCVDGFLARTEGNEYVVMMDGTFEEEEVVKIADNLVSNLYNIDVRSDVLSHISLNIGVVLYQPVNEPFDELLRKGVTVMHQAKNHGDNRCALYHESDKVVELNRTIELEMEDALADRQFHVYLQPKVNMKSLIKVS